MIYKDQLNRSIQLEATPGRIVSLVPSQTKLLVDLGLEDTLIGITKFCVHPEYLKKNKTIVGGTKDIKLDRIKALKPDIILCNKEENTKDIVRACSEICTVHVSDIYTIEDCLELINQYGSIFSIQEIAEKLISSIQFELKKFKESVQENPRKRVAYFIWKHPWMAAAKDTYIDFMLQLNRFDNVFKDIKRYPEITLEALVNLNPDLVLLSSEPYPFKEAHMADIKKAVPNAKIALVDGEAFSWYGSYLLKAFIYFRKLHAEIEASK